MEEIYIQIGENKYPVTLNSNSQDPVDQSCPKWYHVTVSNLPVSGDMIEYGNQIFHEYLAGGKCHVAVYAGNTPGEITSRRKHPHNTRIQRVQAKRKALDLDTDGKCCGLRTRRASLALRMAEQDFYDGRRSGVPETSEFEYWTSRKRRKDKKQALKWKPLDYGERELWWLNLWNGEE